MKDDSTATTWVPDACTLPTEQQPLRLAEFDALFTAAANHPDRLTDRHLRVALTGGTDLADTVRDLTDRETQCCAFFTFTIGTPHPGTVILDIEVPIGQTAVLDALQDRAAALYTGS